MQHNYVILLLAFLSTLKQYVRMKGNENTYKKYYVNQKDCSLINNDYHIIRKGMIVERVINDEMA